CKNEWSLEGSHIAASTRATGTLWPECPEEGVSADHCLESNPARRRPIVLGCSQNASRDGSARSDTPLRARLRGQHQNPPDLPRLPPARWPLQAVVPADMPQLCS